jgi:hypothetical protein
MPIPGNIDPLTVPARDHAARGWPRRPHRLARPRIAELFAASRAGRQGGETARKAGVPLALPSRRHRFRGDDRHRQDHAPLAGRALRDRSPGDRRGAAFHRRHPQVAAAHRRRPRFRDGVHPRCRPGHAVRFQPGRLHAQLPLLPHRHHAAGAQPHAGRDRRPGHAGARCLGEWPKGSMAGLDETRTKAGYSHRTDAC